MFYSPCGLYELNVFFSHVIARHWRSSADLSHGYKTSEVDLETVLDYIS